MDTLGAYRIISQVGSGAFGVVYEGHQPFLDRRVALKILHEVLVNDQKSEAAFMGEARTIARLRHPNIVTVYEFGTASFNQRATTYMAMEFLPGQTLQHRLNGRALPLHEAFDILEQVAAGLDYAHERGVIHRDLKPANIMFTDHGQAVIVDFGLAKLVELAAASSPVTGSGAPMESTVSGTPTYMSPEQLLGEKANAAADLYAFATIAYQILSGHLPYEEDGNPNIFIERIHRPPTPFSEYMSATHGKKADSVFAKALIQAPAERYPTAREFIGALTDALTPERRRERVITIVDPAQAEALRMARITLRGFMWGLVALAIVVMLMMWSGFYRGFLNATPDFVTDGLEIRPRVAGEPLRIVNGVFPGSPSDIAGIRVGDKMVADIETDRRDENANYTVNSIKRSMYGVNWQPQLGDRITRRITRGDEILDITINLDRNVQSLYEMTVLGIPAIVSILAAIWVLRRWGDEPNGQFFAGLMLLQGLALAATGTIHVNIAMAQIFYMAFLAVVIHFILRFPTPARRFQRRPWLLRLLYIPIVIPVFSFFTGIETNLGALNISFALFLLYIPLMITAQTLKWLWLDTRKHKGIWVLLIANYQAGFIGGFATYLAIAGSFPNPPFGNASVAQIVLFGALGASSLLYGVLQAIGFHIVQRKLGPSIITLASQSSILKPRTATVTEK